jgi:hypothetical protein
MLRFVLLSLLLPGTAGAIRAQEHPGAACVGAWYARNLRIFSNLREVLGPKERVFVVYGSGHAYLLHRFLKDNGAATLVDPHASIPAR